MSFSYIRTSFLASVVAVALFALACGGVEGHYKDATGNITLDLNGGKADLVFGAITLHGTYKVDGDKITISGEGQSFVLTIDKDGSLIGPPDSFMPRLKK